MTEKNERLIAIIAEKLGRDPADLFPEMSFAQDLGANSLDTLEIMMALEEEFDIEISDEDGDAIQTIADAEAFLAAMC
jgi:acyl carrier protein